MNFKTNVKLLLTAAGFLSASACAQEKPAPANISTPAAETSAAAGPAKKTDWLKTVNVGKEGGHILGNPDAPDKVTEYISYTCGHCANFEIDGAPKLKNEYVAGGSASLEMRNLPLNAIDLAVSVLARCGETSAFFDRHNYWLKTQKDWMTGTNRISADTKTKAQNDDQAGMLLGIYNDMGLAAYTANTGISDAEAKTCLADSKMLTTIKFMGTQAAIGYGIRGTPSFLLNDKKLNGVHNFPTLKTHLDKE